MQPLQQSSPHSGLLRPNTDPESVLSFVAGFPAQVSPNGEWRTPMTLHFGESLPAALLVAVNKTLRQFPETRISAYGAAGDDLAWAFSLDETRAVRIALRQAQSLEPLRALRHLRELDLASSIGADPSLEPLADLQSLEVLNLEENANDFGVVSSLPNLRHLKLYASRARSYEALRDHPALETMMVSFGSVRDFSPLTTIRTLRGLHLYRISRLVNEHLDPFAEMTNLEALHLDALPRIEGLDALTAGPATTLRFLDLTGIRGLETWRPLGELQALEELWTRESRPHDGDMTGLLNAPRLRCLHLWERFPDDQIEWMRSAFTGDHLSVLRSDLISRGRSPRGGGDVRDTLHVSTPSRVYVSPGDPESPGPA